MPLPGWIVHGASFCAGAAAAAAGLLLTKSSGADGATANGGGGDTQDDAPTPPHQPSPAITNGEYASMPPQMLPTANVRLFRPNDRLAVAFDARSKNPLYVVERLSAASLARHRPTLTNEDATTPAISSRKHKRFREEATLLPYHRARNHHYKKSGYDRGHLAPAADYAADDLQMEDTFVLTNASPQRPRFNQSIWRHLEEFVRDVAKRQGEGKETWVVTGPLWLPASITNSDDGEARYWYSYEGIGRPPSLVAVPTHFYKVIAVIEKRDAFEEPSATSGDATTILFAAFVLPNAELAGENHRIRLIDYAVRLTDLEAVTGLELFPALFGGARGGSRLGRSGDDIPLQKKIADALTDYVRYSANKGGREALEHVKENAALVPWSDEKKWSKGQRRRARQLLRDSAPLPFRHLCHDNEACFKPWIA